MKNFIRLFLFVGLISWSFSGSAQTIEQAFSPQQGATELICKHIRGAEHSIRIAAYSFTSHEIAEELVNARDRGIDVRVVLDKSQKHGRGSLLTYFLKHDVPTRLNSRYHIMHNKFMIFDQKTVEAGSFNYTTSAEKKNAENVLILDDYPNVAHQYQQQWERLYDESQEISFEKGGI